MARTVQLWRDDGAPAPMLATPATLDAVNLHSASLLYEQKFDGIRAIAVVEPRHPSPRVQLLSRNGNDKTAQFPEIVRALRELGAQLNGPVVLDGEIVALDGRGRPASFTALQSRMHLQGTRDIEARTATVPTALIVFDLLREAGEDLRPLPLAARRARLEHLLHVRTSERLREGAYTAGDGERVLAQAEREGWEGLLVKDADSKYVSGVRSRAWRKVKLHRRASLVIGGWTDPKGTRAGLGALMVGSLTDGRGKPARATPASEARLHYCGNVGTGFSDPVINDLLRRLRPLARDASPFVNAPKGRGHHWVEPRLLCEVRFGEWTPEGRLRHPVFIGLRDDIGIEDADACDAGSVGAGRDASPRRPSPHPGPPTQRPSPRTSRKPPEMHASETRPYRLPDNLQSVVDTLHQLEDAGRDGTLTLPDGTLDVTNLRKVFWPGSGFTKGDLLRYYTSVSQWLLPVIADRPLVMKRYPNGVMGKAFYQQRAPDAVPPGVRVDVVDEDDDGPMPRLVGGSLVTLLYVAQLGAISLDPWFSRVSSPESADFVAIDLDPMPGVPFTQVRDVARWVQEALAMLDVPAALKTSGSSGLHVYIPLEEDTTYQSGQLLCQIVATAVATRHPKVATVERAVAKRGRTVYVDYLQNIQGKTLACAYSARASQFAGVSTPLRWPELDDDVRPEDFTLANVLDRFADVGDLWNPVLQGPPVDLRQVITKLGGDPER